MRSLSLSLGKSRITQANDVRCVLLGKNHRAWTACVRCFARICCGNVCVYLGFVVISCIACIRYIRSWCEREQRHFLHI